MSKSLFGIIHEYTNFNFMHKHYMHIDSVCTKYKIDIKSNYIINQNGGNIFKAKIKNTEYSFNYYLNESNTDENGDKLVFIYKNSHLDLIKKKNDEYDNRIHCALLSYKNTDVLKLVIFNSFDDCINISPTTTKTIKYGNLLLKIIIKYAQANNFKSIILDDESKYYCKNTNSGLSYRLQLVHILSHGTTWYGKFGFKFVNDTDNNILIQNKKILDKLKTSNLIFDSLMFLIFDTIVKTKSHTLILGHEKFINSVNNIINIYISNKEQPLYVFFNELTLSECDIMCLIYINLYKMLNLELFGSNSMILELN
jgi:hypothetical protein